MSGTWCRTCPRRPGAYHGDVVGSAGDAILNGVFFFAAIAPVVIVIVFGWLFLRAGKRYDERERAAGRRPR